MAEAYLGGHKIITIRKSDADMKRRQAHWKSKLDREQHEHDADRQAKQDRVIKRLANAERNIQRRNREKFEAWQKRKTAAQQSRKQEV
jgi:predicted secreted protein